MKVPTEQDQKIIIEGRDHLVSYALAPAYERSRQETIVAMFFSRLVRSRPKDDAYELFISGAGFAAVHTLALAGSYEAAFGLIEFIGDLWDETDSPLKENPVATRLLGELRKGLESHRSGAPAMTVDEDFVAMTRAAFASS